jgi:hypothetical protein
MGSAIDIASPAREKRLPRTLAQRCFETKVGCWNAFAEA